MNALVLRAVVKTILEVGQLAASTTPDSVVTDIQVKGCKNVDPEDDPSVDSLCVTARADDTTTLTVIQDGEAIAGYQLTHNKWDLVWTE